MYTIDWEVKQCKSRDEVERVVADNRQLYLLQANFKWTYKPKWFGLKKVKNECTCYYELVPCKLKRATDDGYAYIILDKAFAVDTMYHVRITQLHYSTNRRLRSYTHSLLIM